MTKRRRRVSPAIKRRHAATQKNCRKDLYRRKPAMEICGIDRTGTRPEVHFRWRGVDMVADLDPGVTEPVVKRGTAQPAEWIGQVAFDDYSGLQRAINEFTGS